jgi:hypothetical protein
VKKVLPAAVVSLLLKRLNGRELSEATHNMHDLIAEVKAASAKRKLVFYGVIVVAIGAAAAALVQTDVYPQMIPAVGGLAATAGISLRKLNAFPQSGNEFEEEHDKIRREIIDEVTAAHESVVSGLRTLAANQLTVVDKLSGQLKRLEQAPTTAGLALEALEEQRVSALAQHQEAPLWSKTRKPSSRTWRGPRRVFGCSRRAGGWTRKQLLRFTRCRWIAKQCGFPLG